MAEIGLETGSIDGAYVQDPAVQRRVVDNPNLTVLQRPMPRTWFMYVNMQRDAFSDKRVRQAVAHAINKKSLVDDVFLGMGDVAEHMISPSVFGSLQEPGLQYDPEGAKRCWRARVSRTPTEGRPSRS